MQYTYAEVSPAEWPESKRECKLKWTIVYYKYEKYDNCKNYYSVIVRDENYNYYQIITQENKPYYNDYSDIKTKHISCDWVHEDLWNSLVPIMWKTYYFTVRGYYEKENQVMSYSNQSYQSWEKLSYCDWNLIDKNPYISKSLENQNNTMYSIGIIATLLFIIFYLIYKLYILKK